MKTKISVNLYEKGYDGDILLYFSKVSITKYTDDRTLPYLTINLEVGSSTEPYGAVNRLDAEDRVYYEVLKNICTNNLFDNSESTDSIMKVATKWRKINSRK